MNICCCVLSHPYNIKDEVWHFPFEILCEACILMFANRKCMKCKKPIYHFMTLIFSWMQGYVFVFLSIGGKERKKERFSNVLNNLWLFMEVLLKIDQFSLFRTNLTYTYSHSVCLIMYDYPFLHFFDLLIMIKLPGLWWLVEAQWGVPWML